MTRIRTTNVTLSFSTQFFSDWLHCCLLGLCHHYSQLHTVQLFTWLVHNLFLPVNLIPFWFYLDSCNIIRHHNLLGVDTSRRGPPLIHFGQRHYFLIFLPPNWTYLVFEQMYPDIKNNKVRPPFSSHSLLITFSFQVFSLNLPSSTKTTDFSGTLSTLFTSWQSPWP